MSSYQLLRDRNQHPPGATATESDSAPGGAEQPPIPRGATVLRGLRRDLSTLVRSIRAAVITARTDTQPRPSPQRPWLRPQQPRPSPDEAKSAPPPPHRLLLVFDVIAAAVLASVWTTGLLTRDQETGSQLGTPVAIVAGIIVALPLAMRGRMAVAAWRATLVTAIGYALLLGALLPEPPLYPAHLVVLLAATYSIVVRADRPVALGVWSVPTAGAIALGLVALLFGGAELGFAGWASLVVAVTVPIPVLLGYIVRSRREGRAALAAEQGRAELARAEQAILAERSRIARELHDVVAHHMTAIAVQAEAAPLRAPEDHAALTSDLKHIRGTALSALAEMRHILDVLRDDSAGEDQAPTMSLTGLHALARTARVAGHHVDLDVAIDSSELPDAVKISIHRLIQEAISNVLRHAPGSSMRICVHRDTATTPAAGVEVVNDPPPQPVRYAPDRHGGYGHLGMRERVAALGGALHLGPTPEGGYAVRASLPVNLS